MHRMEVWSGAARRHRGISLMIVLILLVVMSILGIVVLRSSAMQERMSANMRDRSLAFQAAEAALRVAQDQVLVAAHPEGGEVTWDMREPTAQNCADLGICPTGSVPAWRDGPSFGSPDNDGNPTTTTQYWIEYLGVGPARKGACDLTPPSLDCQSPMFRVTARSRAEGRADVILQANIISRIP